MNDINLTARQVADQWYRDWFAFNELYAQWAKRYGVNFTILFCLYAIYHSETAPTPGQVATKLCLSKQTINSALDILEAKGYITRTVAPTNRRSRLIALTREGKELTKGLMEKLYVLEERVFGVLPARDRKSLLRITNRLTSEMEKSVDD